MLTVSVIIPCYNTGHYLAEAIQSVLDQTFDDFEVIVVDDGSTDNTAEVVRGFDDPRIRYAWQENKGLAGARNTGLILARGQYVAFLDADDWFAPDKLSLQTDFLERHSTVGLVAGGWIVTNAHKKPLQIGRPWLYHDELNLQTLLHGNLLPVHSILARAQHIDNAGGFDTNQRHIEDWELWLRLAASGCRMAWLKQTICYYRFHESNMSHNAEGMAHGNFQALERFFSQVSSDDPIYGLRDLAYAEAYLDSFRRHSIARDLAAAREDLRHAVWLAPEWLEQDGRRIMETIAGVAAGIFVADHNQYLDDVLECLPEELTSISSRQRVLRAMTQMSRVFSAFDQEDWQTVREAYHEAIWNDPRVLTNRGGLRMYSYAWKRRIITSAESRIRTDSPNETEINHVVEDDTL